MTKVRSIDTFSVYAGSNNNICHDTCSNGIGSNDINSKIIFFWQVSKDTVFIDTGYN